MHHLANSVVKFLCYIDEQDLANRIFRCLPCIHLLAANWIIQLHVSLRPGLIPAAFAV